MNPYTRRFLLEKALIIIGDGCVVGKYPEAGLVAVMVVQRLTVDDDLREEAEAVLRHFKCYLEEIDEPVAEGSYKRRGVELKRNWGSGGLKLLTYGEQVSGRADRAKPRQFVFQSTEDRVRGRDLVLGNFQDLC